MTKPPTHTTRMKQRIDSPEGRTRYGQRFATVEPVFGNLRYNKGLNRFTLRGRRKVDTQWQLFCLVHKTNRVAPDLRGSGMGRTLIAAVEEWCRAHRLRGIGFRPRGRERAEPRRSCRARL